MEMCEGVDDEYACLQCSRPECLLEHKDLVSAKIRAREAKRRYYWKHREEVLRKQREYDKAHPRRHRRKK